MSKNVAMFVDVANMYYAARGQDVDVDYVALLKHATKGRDLIRAYAYTGLDPENENQRKFIDFLAKNGYKPVVKDIRKFGDGRMKANLDIELVVDLFRLADRMDIAVIVSGDGDFAPAIKALQDQGIRAEVISFKPNTSSDLIAVADEFTDIMKIASISRKEARASRSSMSAPEMPAKEVNPEFGFREASPSVAAAALAALKGGTAATGTGNGRRTRGDWPTRRIAGHDVRPEPDEAAVPLSATEVIAEGDEQARRRRRRRGGRGRGRTRRETDGAPRGSGRAGEVGWEEFDDLSQLDGARGADKEYTFAEVDPETLAELGLTPEEVEAMAVGTPAAEDEVAEAEAKPKRRDRAAARPTRRPTQVPLMRMPRRSAELARARRVRNSASAEGDAKPKRATRSRKADARTTCASADEAGRAEASNPLAQGRCAGRAGRRGLRPRAVRRSHRASGAASAPLADRGPPRSPE